MIEFEKRKNHFIAEYRVKGKDNPYPVVNVSWDVAEGDGEIANLSACYFVLGSYDCHLVFGKKGDTPETLAKKAIAECTAHIGALIDEHEKALVGIKELIGR